MNITTLSKAHLFQQQGASSFIAPPDKGAHFDLTSAADGADIKWRLTSLLLEKLLGQKISLMDYELWLSHADQSVQSVLEMTETIQVNELSLEINLTLSGASELKLDIEQAQAILSDPLVINFAGMTAQLLPERSLFDLDSNGILDAIPGLQLGSAYIALDRNQNGKIDNGSELFGPTSGEGFTELAEFDQDNNNKIDSRDPVFAKLVLWRPDSQDSRSLRSMGVGELSLISKEDGTFYRNNGERLRTLALPGLLFDGRWTDWIATTD